MKIFSCLAVIALSLTALPIHAETTNWTGTYAGLSLGSIKQSEKYTDSLPNGSNLTVSNKTARNSTAAIHAGYNNQINQWVFGIEADLEQPNLDYKNIPAGSTWGSKTKTIAQASIRPRIGYAFQKALVYGTAGVAVARLRHEYSNDFSIPEDTDVIDKNKSGWTAGGGLEYLISDKLALRGEYRHADFGKITDRPVKVWSGWLDSHETTQNTISAGISYLFF